MYFIMTLKQQEHAPVIYSDIDTTETGTIII